LAAYYAHEAQQKRIKLARCEPDKIEGSDDYDLSQSVGCFISSDEALDECPFCGQGGEVQTIQKPAPKADPNVELDVKLAEKTLKEKKGKGGVVKVSPADVKAAKKARQGDAPDKPSKTAEEAPKADAMATTKPESQAIDLPSESVGGTAADLDAKVDRINELIDNQQRQELATSWEIGALLSEIRDKKLWSLVRHEDGTYAYPNFNSFCAQKFGWSPGSNYANLLMRIAANMSQEDAAMGSLKAKAILEAHLPDDITKQLIAFATERGPDGKFVHSFVELRSEIQNKKNPQLPAATGEPVRAMSADADDESDDLDDNNDLDDEDDDEEETSTKSSTKPERKPKPAVMAAVTFESKTFSIPLVQKGSQIKPAKRIQDEPHGTLSVPGGTKIHFKLVIGEDGQIAIQGNVETPY
jgi:hypothetical protein